MSYKYLDYEREKELIHVLCGDYNLKSTLEFIDGYLKCRRDNEEK